MKKYLLLLFLFAGSLLAGCQAHDPVETAAERNYRIKQNSELQMQMLVDDWDYLWLVERETHMTQWHPRNGR